MLKVAITGNIASGKSEVEKLLKKRGYFVIDSDRIAHQILKYDEETIEKIHSFFGHKDIYEEDGTISRKKLGKLVFSNPGMRYKLEFIMHPVIKVKLAELLKENSDKEVLFVAVPLLFEANMQSLFDKTLFVAADESLRLKRILRRDNIEFDEAKDRISSQLPQEQKMDKSDFVIYNNTNIASLEFQLDLILKRLIPS